SQRFVGRWITLTFPRGAVGNLGIVGYERVRVRAGFTRPTSGNRQNVAAAAEKPTSVWMTMFGSRAAWRTTVWGEVLSEFLGTCVLSAFGAGVVAMAVAALNSSGRAATPTTIFLASGDWLLITFGWMVAVVLGVYVAGGVSGAHINPAVTISLAARRK